MLIPNIRVLSILLLFCWTDNSFTEPNEAIILERYSELRAATIVEKPRFYSRSYIAEMLAGLLLEDKDDNKLKSLKFVTKHLTFVDRITNTRRMEYEHSLTNPQLTIYYMDKNGKFKKYKLTYIYDNTSWVIDKTSLVITDR